MIKKKCIKCGKIFKKYPCYFKTRPGKFCSKKCMLKFNSIDWKINNPVKNIDLSGRNNPMYGKTPHNYNPNGSKRRDGYIRVTIHNKRKLKHRVLFEKAIGRKLRSNEVVHHINGDNTDNNINNLLAMTQSTHFKLHHMLGSFKGVRRCKQ